MGKGGGASGARGGGGGGGGAKSFPQNGSYSQKVQWAEENTKDAKDYSLSEFRSVVSEKNTEGEYKAEAILSKAAPGSTLQESDGTNWRKLSNGDWKAGGKSGEVKESGQLATILTKPSNSVKRIKFK